MQYNKWTMGLLAFLAAVTVSACAAEDENTEPAETDSGVEESVNHDSGHADMDHSGSAELPEGLKNAHTPLYEVGGQATINSDHMEGMNGAEATIVGAYDTTVYAVTYTPTEGGEAVSNHKWVIHEELENAGNTPLEPGDTAVLDADHMDGMDGVTAVINSAEKTTVYMVDFTSTNGGEKVANHKWVTEKEMDAE